MSKFSTPLYYSIALATLIGAAGCTLHAASLDAQPKIAIDGKGRSLALELAPAVSNSFKLRSTVASGRVDGWRSALTTGFVNGFRHAFVLHAPKPSVTLRIEHTDVQIIPAAVKGNDRDVAARVTIKYKAILVEGDKRTELVGEGVSDPGSTFGVIFRKAIERMYEDLSIKAFTPEAMQSPGIPFRQ